MISIANLVLLEGVAHLLHRGLGHAILDDQGDVGVAAAVDPAVVGQVGPFAASAGTAVTAAAQAAKERLAFRQRMVLRCGLAGLCRWYRFGLRSLWEDPSGGLVDCGDYRLGPSARSAPQAATQTQLINPIRGTTS